VAGGADRHHGESDRLKAQGYDRGADGRPYTDAFEPRNLCGKSTLVNPYHRYVPDSVTLGAWRAAGRWSESRKPSPAGS
jgi:hypothetical protein